MRDHGACVTWTRVTLATHARYMRPALTSSTLHVVHQAPHHPHHNLLPPPLDARTQTRHARTCTCHGAHPSNAAPGAPAALPGPAGDHHRCGSAGSSTSCRACWWRRCGHADDSGAETAVQQQQQQHHGPAAARSCRQLLSTRSSLHVVACGAHTCCFNQPTLMVMVMMVALRILAPDLPLACMLLAQLQPDAASLGPCPNALLSASALLLRPHPFPHMQFDNKQRCVQVVASAATVLPVTL